MIQMFFLNIISTNKKLIVLPLFVLPTFVYILIVTYLIDVLPFVYLLICISIYIYYIYIYTLQKTLMVGEPGFLHSSFALGWWPGEFPKHRRTTFGEVFGAGVGWHHEES